MTEVELTNELSQNFIDFSHEANGQRAFADARDGLKPGQRACLWEMFVKGYTSNKPHVKSAKISGGVIASWWPHGDAAIYDTFARMSQPWINNLPEVDWHGANGSIQISGEPAASRYTEARLSKVIEEGMLANIKKENVPMKMNFSEDEEWPEVFPAIIPRLMVNGCQGIGSTIANVWLPHSLSELAQVIEKYVKENELDYSNLAPSFPTGGIITNKSDIPEIYKTGKGKVILRGRAEIKGNVISITEIPYQVYVEPLIDQIKKLALDGTINAINNVINKSDKKRMLIEVECESNPNQVLNMLYQNTDLQKTFSANQYALVGKTPKLLTLKEYLDIYLNHNYECIKRENIYDCEKSKERLEIVIGLIKALEDIDNIIKLIKESESSEIAKSNLISKYAFTERQAKAILDMKLSKLAHLEKISLNEEKEALTSTISKCNEIIENVDKQKEIYLERFSNLVAKYGDARRTELAQISLSRGEKEIIKVEPEKVVVVITEGGLIKRIPVASFKTQRRNTKGVKTQNDITSMIIRTNTIDNLMVFSNKGTMYKILVDNIPEGDNTSKGVHVSSLAKMGPNEVPTLIYSIYRDTNAKYVVFVSKNGLIKKVPLDEYTSITRRTGVAATKFREGDELAAVFLADEEDVLIASNSGMMIRVSANEIPETTKVATGVKGIGLKDDEYVLTALPIRDKNDSLAVFDKDGSAKKISLSEFTCQRRGGRGIIYTKGTPAALTLISDEDKILVVGDKTSVCISATEIASSNRTSLGVKAIKDSAIVSVSKI